METMTLIIARTNIMIKPHADFNFPTVPHMISHVDERGVGWNVCSGSLNSPSLCAYMMGHLFLYDITIIMRNHSTARA
jgi:hypothetical protein